MSAPATTNKPIRRRGAAASTPADDAAAPSVVFGDIGRAGAPVLCVEPRGALAGIIVGSSAAGWPTAIAANTVPTSAIVGTPWFPVVGTLMGAVAGAFGGAALYELLIVKKTTGASIKTGVGAALGRIAGVIAKVAIGLAMLMVLAFNY